MIRKRVLTILSFAVLMLADAATMNIAQAFDMGNMMNPSRWFNDNDRYDRGYYRGYGYGPYGYGGGPYGPYGGWGGYPGYGGWGGGYPGWGGYPGYGHQAPSTIVVNPSPENSRQAEPAPPRLPE